MISWSQDQLEASSKVAKKTIADFERGVRQPYPRTLAAIRTALEAAGVEFIPENGGGPGVRLRKAT
jgi:transcriptional regulator with XRE-family HTH domain